MKLNLVTFLSATVLTLTGTVFTFVSAPKSFGAPLSQEEALSRVVALQGGVTRGAEGPEFRGTLYDKEGRPAIYLFSYSGNEGFMLISADDAVAPLLGYSKTNSFQIGDMGENVSSFISLYVDGIMASRGAAPYRAPATTRADDKAPVGPLMSTTWNQTAPYNNLCPRVNGMRGVTGCVATAMAQVMKYWEYPPQGKGEISYSPVSMDETLSMNFEETVFDWANMLDSYRRDYTPANATAVATLMKACGYSVKMSYANGSSGAYSRDIANALKTYFGYDKGAAQKERSAYSTQESWNNMIYNELVNVGPVILDGQSSEGGHCFVCDGYDGNGYFHINWGWGGISDGYFLLNELTPGEIGTGGHYGGYNMDQDAITGIMPPVGRLTCNGITVDNAASDSGNVSGKGYVFRIDDPNYILISVNLRITGGHITSPLYVTVYETDDPNNFGAGNKVVETTFSNNINASDGEVTYTSAISIPNFNPSKYYVANLAYDLKGKRTTIDSIILAASADVDTLLSDRETFALTFEAGVVSVSGDFDATLQLYDGAGRAVAEATGHNPSVRTDGLSAGVYIARAVNSKGESRVLKLLLK